MAKSQPKKQSKSSSKARKNQGNRNMWIGIAAVVLIGVIVGAVLIFNQPGEKQAENALPSEISVQEAYNLYQDGVFLLDVRTQGEWDEIHVPNATLIPLDELEGRVNELSKDQEIVVMCRSGNRSQVGRDILRNAGFENVTSMAGGIVNWQTAGYPTVP